MEVLALNFQLPTNCYRASLPPSKAMASTATKSAPPQGKDASAHLGFEATVPVRKALAAHTAPGVSTNRGRVATWRDLRAEKDHRSNTVDAAEYKHVLLGLIRLKYISDTGGNIRISNVEHSLDDGKSWVFPVSNERRDILEKAETKQPLCFQWDAGGDPVVVFLTWPFADSPEWNVKLKIAPGQEREVRVHRQWPMQCVFSKSNPNYGLR